MNARLKIFKLY